MAHKQHTASHVNGLATAQVFHQQKNKNRAHHIPHHLIKCYSILRDHQGNQESKAKLICFSQSKKFKYHPHINNCLHNQKLMCTVNSKSFRTISYKGGSALEKAQLINISESKIQNLTSLEKINQPSYPKTTVVLDSFLKISLSVFPIKAK